MFKFLLPYTVETTLLYIPEYAEQLITPIYDISAEDEEMLCVPVIQIGNAFEFNMAYLPVSKDMCDNFMRKARKAIFLRLLSDLEMVTIVHKGVCSSMSGGFSFESVKSIEVLGYPEYDNCIKLACEVYGEAFKLAVTADMKNDFSARYTEACEHTRKDALNAFVRSYLGDTNKLN